MVKASSPSAGGLEAVYNHSNGAGGITDVVLKALWAAGTEMQVTDTVGASPSQ